MRMILFSYQSVNDVELLISQVNLTYISFDQLYLYAYEAM